MKQLKKLSFLMIGLLFASFAISGTTSSASMSKSKTVSSTNMKTVSNKTINNAGPTIAQMIANNRQFSTLEAALQAAGLTNVLNIPGQYTIFAPTNKAFVEI